MKAEAMENAKDTLTPTLDLRWVMPSDPKVPPRCRLQQRWVVTEYDGDRQTKQTSEWRDVPLVIED